MEVIKFDSVYKKYRLGVIGGGTLQGDLQSWFARMKGNEDPNTQIGFSTIATEKEFFALRDINFTVDAGETLGIIGSNGAGKSTLLKLLSRITAPTMGTVTAHGRIASMLEVGTGFHPELTGRENIFLNGAILGMNKREVQRKLDEIIDFSECEKFIDTPVKRYSSGMYVKLAFSVAAHLDSEILVMDEVLAVGDVKFQRKCLGKMSNVATDEGKTVLYVSHNMDTIRQLCNRCVVLNRGELVYNGEVEKAIQHYQSNNEAELQTDIDLTNAPRTGKLKQKGQVYFTHCYLINKKDAFYGYNEPMYLKLHIISERNAEKLSVRLDFKTLTETSVAFCICEDIGNVEAGKEYDKVIRVDIDSLAMGRYIVGIAAFIILEGGTIYEHDGIYPAFSFEKTSRGNMEWKETKWGRVRLKDAELVQ